jgi:hypothetical protein
LTHAVTDRLVGASPAPTRLFDLPALAGIKNRQTC